jgi:hypothetical protein
MPSVMSPAQPRRKQLCAQSTKVVLRNGRSMTRHCPNGRRTEHRSANKLVAMNTPTPITSFFGLNPTDHTTNSRARFAITALTAFATVVQIIVWLLIGIFCARLDSPWWFWTPASGLAINACLYYLSRVKNHWTTTTATPATAANHKESL